MERIVVTGGAGYVGSHVCKALAAQGYLPVTVDDLSTGHAQAVKWGPLEQGSIADRAFIDRVFATHRPRAVMHFAGSALIGESVSRPLHYYRNNVAGTLALVEAMLENGVIHFVYSSTCAVYGVPERMPITEALPHAPVTPYGESYAMVEQMLRSVARAQDLRCITLRYLNAAGADADGEIGESHAQETHLIPLAIEAALGRRPWLHIFGDDYPTPDGTCIRDYIHVSDLADGHIRALRALLAGRDGFAAINLGIGQGYSVREVLTEVARVTGKTVPIRVAARRPGDPPTLVADPSRARTELGWLPSASALPNIIESAYRWTQSSLARAAQSVP